MPVLHEKERPSVPRYTTIVACDDGFVIFSNGERLTHGFADTLKFRQAPEGLTISNHLPIEEFLGGE